MCLPLDFPILTNAVGTSWIAHGTNLEIILDSTQSFNLTSSSVPAAKYISFQRHFMSPVSWGTAIELSDLSSWFHSRLSQSIHYIDRMIFLGTIFILSLIRAFFNTDFYSNPVEIISALKKMPYVIWPWLSFEPPPLLYDKLLYLRVFLSACFYHVICLILPTLDSRLFYVFFSSLSLS